MLPSDLLHGHVVSLKPSSIKITWEPLYFTLPVLFLPKSIWVLKFLRQAEDFLAHIPCPPPFFFFKFLRALMF